MTTTEDRTVAKITPKGAKQLMKILFRRGYFHDHLGDTEHSDNADDDSDDNEFTAAGSLVVMTSQGDFVRISALAANYRTTLQQRGRLTISQAAEALQIDSKVAKRVFRQVVAAENDSSLLRNGDDELLTEPYLDHKMEELLRQLDQAERGMLRVTQVAKSIFRLPFDLTLQVLQRKLPTVKDLLLKSSTTSGKVVMTVAYWNQYQVNVLEYFASQSEPVQVSEVCEQRDWELSWVLEMLHSSQKDQNGLFELHGDIFVPRNFTQRQRQAVLDGFTTTGVVTSAQVIGQHGLLYSQIRQDILRQYPSAVIVLSQCMVHPDMVVGPLQAAIQEPTTKWLDLQSYLPPQLWEQQEDCLTLILDHILPEGDRGVAVVQPDGGLYFSASMVQEATQTIMSPLWEAHAKLQAQKLDQEVGAETVIVQQQLSSQQDKRHHRKSSSMIDYGFVPTMEIARALVQHYPGLSEYLPGNDDSEDSVLLSICETAFGSDQHVAMYQKAVETELEGMAAARESRTRTSRKESTSKIQNIQAAFEDSSCFATACYMIQEHVKFLDYAANNGMDPVSMNILTEECLQGCCADFTSRLTQYCLFQNAVDTTGLSFHEIESSTDETSSRLYYGPVNTAVRQYKKTFLSCQPDPETPDKPRDPLVWLRTSLPGTMGATLARQWVLCGGQCYQGRPSDEIRPGQLNELVTHMEENCLPICGLPFKKLDKKRTKQFLDFRRQCLSWLLDSETDPAAVLDLTVMLLFQLLKKVVVSGSLLRGPILELLCTGRKISSVVAQELKSMAQHIEDGEEIDPEKVERVRACGLSRDKNKIGVDGTNK